MNLDVNCQQNSICYICYELEAILSTHLISDNYNPYTNDDSFLKIQHL